MNSIPYDSWCTTFDFLVVFNGRRFIERARGTKISYDRWSDIAHVVSGLSTARKPWDISFLPTSFKSRHSLRPVRARDTAYFESYEYTTDVFPIFRPVLSKDASKEKKCGTYRCCYKFWLWIFLFCNLFFQNFFVKTFFPNFFFKFLSQNFCYKIFSQNFCFKILFQIFFPKFFWVLLSMPPRLYRLNRLYVSVLWKIWYTASGRNWTLVSCDKVLFFDLYCSRHTRREKFC